MSCPGDELVHGLEDTTVIPRCPRWLLITVYFLYLGLVTADSYPLFANISWGIEGERMGSAQIVLNGGLPIRDVYLPHGPFPEVIRPLLAFWLFGESLAADRIVGMLIEPLVFVAAAFYVWRVFPTGFWRLVGLLGFALYPLQLLTRHIPVFLALGLLTAWVYERRPRQLVWAGIITGLGYVMGSVDQATFLVATVLAFPFAALAEHIMRQLAGVGRDRLNEAPIRSVFVETACPLFGGLIIGLIPFLAYMGLTGTAGLFVEDLVSRAHADAYALGHVWHQTSYPSLSRMTLVWYVVPAFYVVLAAVIILRIHRHGERLWTPLLPTLLFGVLSFVYAIRHFIYWKLAVVLFPFIVAFVYVLYVVMIQQQHTTACRDETGLGSSEKILLSLSGYAMIALLADSLTRDWSAKLVWPRFLFPVLALVIIAATVAAGAGRVRARRWLTGLVVACPLAALAIATWYCNDAKPPLLSAQLAKPRLVSDAVRLVRVMATGDGRLTRDRPQYVEDETLRYLRRAAREHRAVVILVPTGIYYFLAGVSPPNRFADISVTMSERWSQEVIRGLDRTKAELLVACDDGGQRMGGWAMRPVLSGFIAANYADSGRRLNSQLLGDCPFSVWVHRKSRNGTLR